MAIYIPKNSKCVFLKRIWIQIKLKVIHITTSFVQAHRLLHISRSS